MVRAHGVDIDAGPGVGLGYGGQDPRKMKYRANFMVSHHIEDFVETRDVPPHETHVFLSLEEAVVGGLVEDDHVLSALQELSCQLRPYESRPSRNENRHH